MLCYPLDTIRAVTVDNDSYDVLRVMIVTENDKWKILSILWEFNPCIGMMLDAQKSMQIAYFLVE